MSLRIRLIAPSEYGLAAQLVLGVFQHSVASSMEPQGVKTFLEYSTSDSIRARDTSGCVTYVALMDSELVGVLHVKNGDHISLLFVRPELQGNGIGRALIRAADATHVLATVNSSTNAVRAYESYGFAASGPALVSDGIRYVPMQRTVA